MKVYLLEVRYRISEQEDVEQLFPAFSEGVILSHVYREEDVLTLLADREVSFLLLSAVGSLHPAVVSCNHARRWLARVTFQEESDDALTAFPAERFDTWYQGEGRVKYLCTTEPVSEHQVAWLERKDRVAFWEDTFDLASAAWTSGPGHPCSAAACKTSDSPAVLTWSDSPLTPHDQEGAEAE
jgi:hypothetical protein